MTAKVRPQMSKTTHTSGPWKAMESPSRGAYIHAGGNARIRLAELPRSPDVGANARLIAAAPEMLEALRAAARILIGRDSPLAIQVRAAIAKAEGGVS